MILGIGTDMIETERVKLKISKNRGFKEHVFSKNEIGYCEKMTNTYQNYAARFAAKEALLKAFGTGLSSDLLLHEIEILNDEKGKPFFNFIGETKNIIYKKGLTKIHVSISHLKDIASAFVIIEQ